MDRTGMARNSIIVIYYHIFQPEYPFGLTCITRNIVTGSWKCERFKCERQSSANIEVLRRRLVHSPDDR